MRLLLLFLLGWCLPFLIHAQDKNLTYYLPDIKYDEAIPTPKDVLGYQIGDWHISHDQLVYYMRKLAETSPRVTLTEYARSHEQRPLLYLTITSEKNHARIDDIKKGHLALQDPNVSADIDTRKEPVVLYQGYSIHGNEPSGGNAAPLVAYYLAAGKSKEVERLLEDAVILLDPCYNPDGFNRFASWANTHKNDVLTADSADREYNESWPRGRTNHYWFDLNRDWLLVQHPESQGRIQAFHEWKPNVLTDHHEMGKHATYFFMPGVQTRVNPVTPARNQELTTQIGQYHADALDNIGSLYYSEEGFDDFYLGKGSTYPDANGCIGILFEQASSRGHLQETDNGLLAFPYTIRNQVTTSLSTHKAVYELREELLNFQRKFYQDAQADAEKSTVAAFVFGDAKDPNRTQHLVEVLRRHQIEVYRLSEQVTADGKSFQPQHSYVVPVEQQQYRMIRGIFNTQTTFTDSLFYDVSSWTLPLAFNIPYAELSRRQYQPGILGKALADVRDEINFHAPDYSDYAYLMPWDDYYAPTVLHRMMEAGLRTKVSHVDFTAGGRDYVAGTVLVPVQNQSLSGRDMHELILAASQELKVSIYEMDTGLTPSGPDLGSRNFSTLDKPEVLLLVGSGVTSYDAGEVWHLLDQRYRIAVTKAETSSFGRLDLDRYTALVMVDGNYQLSKANVEKLRRWIQGGGVLICMKRAARWAKANGLANVDFVSGKNAEIK
ncbi:MAG: M14 family metallopeptidase, partial [Bacteroidota bacterium]